MIKNYPSILLCLFLTIFFHSEIRAQEDHPSGKLSKSYNFLTMAHRDDTSLWKLNILPISVLGKHGLSYNGTPLFLAYEKKIRPDLSYQLELQTIFLTTSNSKRVLTDTFVNTDSSITYQTIQYNATNLMINITVGGQLRYYYNMNRRMHRHHTGNNFSANYVALRFRRNLLHTSDDPKLIDKQFEGDFGDHYFHPFYCNTVTAFYGIQRRLFKYFYFDAGLGISYRYAKQSLRPVRTYNTYTNSILRFTEQEKAPRFLPVVEFKFGFAF